MTKDQSIDTIAKLLQEVGEVHHVYFSDTQGSDDDWATFYSEWLLSRSALPSLLGTKPVRSGLTRDLVVLDEEYAARPQSEPWPEFYARSIVSKYT
jgi:hypothetical protein